MNLMQSTAREELPRRPPLSQCWRAALRPASLPKILLPIGVGVALALAGHAPHPVSGILLVSLAGLLLQAAIVLLNDLADADADREHMLRHPSSLGPRVIPLGWLSPRAVGLAGSAALLAFAFFTQLREATGGAHSLGLLAVAAMLLPLLYSFPPARLNYRGGGELLETFGVGLLLPWLGWGYCGLPLGDYPLLWSLPALGLAASSALGSGLGHVAMDRHTGKRTLAVLLGPRRVARLALLLLGTVITGLSLFLHSRSDLPALQWAMALALPVFTLLPSVRMLVQSADMPARAHSTLADAVLKAFKLAQKQVLLLCWLALILLARVFG